MLIRPAGAVTAADWTEADSLAARREGWNLFDVGPDYGLQVQRYDNAAEVTLPDGTHPPQLANDWEAHRLVRDGSARGSALHVKALALVGAEERDTILNPEG